MGEITSLRLTRAEDRKEKLSRLYHRMRMDNDPILRNLSGGKNFVPGRGSMFPEVIFVGEAPGRNEDAMRKPFIGASGKILDELLESVGLERTEVFITNSVKWWPTNKSSPGGKKSTRPPTDREKALCRAALFMEFRILGFPPVVVLGKHAVGVMSSRPVPRAEWKRYAPRLENSYERRMPPFPFLYLYHPAAALYQSSLKPRVFEDFQKVMEPPRATQ